MLDNVIVINCHLQPHAIVDCDVSNIPCVNNYISNIIILFIIRWEKYLFLMHLLFKSSLISLLVHVVSP